MVAMLVESKAGPWVGSTVGYSVVLLALHLVALLVDRMAVKTAAWTAAYLVDLMAG